MHSHVSAAPTAGASRRPEPSRDVHRPRAPFWLRVTLAVIAFAVSSSSVLLGFLTPGVAERFNGNDDAAHMWVALLIWPIALVVYLLCSFLLVRGADRAPLRSLGLRIDGRALAALATGIGISVLIAVLVAGASVLVAQPAPSTADSATGGMGSVNGLASLPAWLIVAYLLSRSFVLQGIGEEVLMRGYLLQSLRACPRKSVLVTAAAFTLPHLLSAGGQQTWWDHAAYLAIPFGFSLSAAYLAILFRSVWAAVGIHGGFHLGMVAAAIVGMTGFSTWTCIAFGLAHAAVGAIAYSRISNERWNEVARRGPYAR